MSQRKTFPPPDLNMMCKNLLLTARQEQNGAHNTSN